MISRVCLVDSKNFLSRFPLDKIRSVYYSLMDPASDLMKMSSSFLQVLSSYSFLPVSVSVSLQHLAVGIRVCIHSMYGDKNILIIVTGQLLAWIQDTTVVEWCCRSKWLCLVGLIVVTCKKCVVFSKSFLLYFM